MLIGFLGAPRSGKTSLALGLGYELKKRDCAVEYIPELARSLTTKNKFEHKTGRLDQDALYMGERDTHAMYKSVLPESIIIADVCCTICALYGYAGNADDMIVDAAMYDLLFFCALPPEEAGVGRDANRFHTREQAIKLESGALDLIQTYQLAGVEMLGAELSLQDRVDHAVQTVLNRKRMLSP